MIDRQKAAEEYAGTMIMPPLKRFALLILCALSVGLAPASGAEDEKISELKIANGKVFQSVTITKVTPSEMTIIHESGVARIPLKDLPEDLKAKFGYDPAKAEANAQANAQAAKQYAEAAKRQAEAKALMASAKPGIFIVDRYSGEQGILVYGCNLDGLDAISGRQEMQKRVGKAHAPGKWNIATTGQGDGNSSWKDHDKYYLLIDLPKKDTYLENSSVGGMFVKAGTVKLNDDTRIQAFRYVGLAKDDNVGFETIDR